MVPPSRNQFHSNFLVFNFHLTVRGLSQVKHITAEAPRAINVLKFLLHLFTGCSREVLSLENYLFPPILNYADSIIYGLAAKSSSKLLNPIQTASLCIAVRAFCTSPAFNFCTETWTYVFTSHSQTRADD